ncbi:MAG TPA: hypothetical protein VM661_09835 [Candidatus Sulfotelmatobacter sp.]|jgi:hypothetical protein|nr:hypothetical protein [Candidatus Sulfotelmatobacter sp.]
MSEEYNIGLRVSPAIGGAAFSLNEWVAIITIIYVLLQVGLLVPKYVRLFRQWMARGVK